MSSIITKIAGLFLGFIVLLLIRETYIEFEYKRLSKKHNCGVVPTRLDRPFGIPAFLRLFNAKRENNLLEFNQQIFVDAGRETVRGQLNFEMNFVTIHPDNIKAILATNFKDYSLGLRHVQLFPLLGNGIFTLSGAGWKHSRAMLRPQFSREQVSQLESLNDHVSSLLQLFKTKSHNGRYFDAQKLFHNLTLDTATEFLFGESVNSLGNESRNLNPTTVDHSTVSAADFAESFNYCLTILAYRAQAGTLYWLVNIPEFYRKVKTCKTFVDYFVRKALQNSSTSKTEPGGRYIFINELTKETKDATIIRDQSFNILLAGRDTTASLLSYITYYLARDKRVLNKLREIILEEFGTTAESLNFESLKRCTYLNHVINEALRMNPIVPINFRTAINDTILPCGGGPDESQPVFVKKGTQVVYSVYTIHRNPKYWGEDSEQFRPERWSENKVHNWDYLPFNGGPRICLGQQFALTETAYTVVRILQTFKDINLEPDQQNGTLKNLTSLTSSVATGVRANFVLA